jgi:hypothetical protein
MWPQYDKLRDKKKKETMKKKKNIYAKEDHQPC